MRSNCLLFAVPEFLRRVRAWVAMGKPKHDRPKISIMPSVLAPPWVPHFQVTGGGKPGLEFVPLNAERLRWWQLPVAILFPGRVRVVEFEPTQPVE